MTYSIKISVKSSAIPFSKLSKTKRELAEYKSIKCATEIQELLEKRGYSVVGWKDHSRGSTIRFRQN